MSEVKVKKSVKVKVLKKVDDSWMSIPGLMKHLQEVHKVTNSGAPITLLFAHYRVNMGYLPHSMGGNVLEVGTFRDVKYVRILDKVQTKVTVGRKKGQVGTKHPSITSKSLIYDNK